jgi:Spy/CpxP family protein refolding chaperone
MVIKIILGLTLALFLATEELSALAKRQAGDSTQPGIPSLIRSTLSLDLTNEQKVRVKAILAARNDRMTDLQKKAVGEMEEYIEATLMTGTSKSQLLKKNKQVQTNYEALRNYQLETWLFIRPVLTEEQLIKLRNKQDLAFDKVVDAKAKKES